MPTLIQRPRRAVEGPIRVAVKGPGQAPNAQQINGRASGTAATIPPSSVSRAVRWTEYGLNALTYSMVGLGELAAAAGDPGPLERTLPFIVDFLAQPETMMQG